MPQRCDRRAVGYRDQRMSQHARRFIATCRRRRGTSLRLSAPAGRRLPPESSTDDQWFTEERCAQNRDAGTITYLTGFDYAAAASMVDVFVAEERGYYDELCLDVDVIAQLLDGQLSVDRRWRGPVRLRRIVQRNDQLRVGQRRRTRRGRRRGPLPDRRPDPQAGHGRNAGRPRTVRRSGSRAR